MTDKTSPDPTNTEQHEREGSVPLLGLELITIENSGQNQAMEEDSKQFAAQSPLLGTIFLSGRIHKRPEKSKKSKVASQFGVHRHPAEFVEIGGT